MFASLMSRYSTTARSALRYVRASAGEAMSGSVTISTSGVPARLKSTRLVPVASSWRLLPTSSSRCRRRMPQKQG
jgi:hypothetical protein